MFRIPVGTTIEVVDITCKNRTRVGTVTGVIGDRIHIKYAHDAKANCKGRFEQLQACFYNM